jgi:CHAT domain-containing protein
LTADNNHHPDSVVLAAFIEGRLSGELLPDVSAHVEHCEECLSIVGETARLEREVAGERDHAPSAKPAIPSRKSARPFLIAAILALVLILTFVVWRENRRRSHPLEPLAKTLAKARYRPLEARLDDFPYAPLPASRSADSSRAIDAATLRARADAADLLLKLGDGETGDHEYAAGVATLIAGDHVQDAVARLEKATAASPTSHEYWNALAVARYEAWQQTGDARFLVDALVAVDHALRLREDSAAALFNRALVLEALEQREQALQAFDKYRQIDPSSGWAAEAAQHEQRLRRRSTGWRNVIPELYRFVREGNEQEIARIVDAYRQEIRSWSEAVFLAEWANGSAEGLAVAQSVAGRLQRTNGEMLLTDHLAVIRDAASSPDRTEALRQGHRLFLAAGGIYKTREHLEEAQRLFAQAATAFRSAGSPMSAMADYYVANCSYDLGDSATALSLLDHLLTQSPERHKAVRASALWERGTVLTRLRRMDEALAAQLESLRIFDSLGEVQNGAFMANAAAASLALLGRSDEAWRLRMKAFRANAESGNAEYQQMALDASARTEALTHRWDRAFSLLALSLDPSVTRNARVTESSLLWHALAASRLDLPGLQHDMAAAASIAAKLPEPALRRSAEGDLSFARAIIARSEDPRRAITLLTSFIEDARSRSDDFLIAEAYLERALAHRAMGDDNGAVADLTTTLAQLSSRQKDDAPSEAAAYRDAFFATADTARRELLDIHARRNDASAAFALLRSTYGMPAGTSHGVLLAAYVALEDRLLIFALQGDAVHIYRVSVPATHLGRIADELKAAVGTGQDDQARRAAKRLAAYLVKPIAGEMSGATTVMLAVDERLSGIPFAALPLHDDQPLVRSAAVVLCPAVEHRRSHPASKLLDNLVVGNPQLDREVFSLPELTAAELEARDVASLLEAAPLIGQHATKAAVLERLQRASIAHLATHALATEGNPSRTSLLFAASRDDAGALYAREIEGLRLSNLQLVVLTGCRTGMPISASGKASSLASAFIRAGARNVVGTLWDVADRNGRRFAISFHRLLRAGVAPAEAVRQSQLQMIDSADPADRQLEAWAAFQAYSAASEQ